MTATDAPSVQSTLLSISIEKGAAYLQVLRAAITLMAKAKAEDWPEPLVMALETVLVATDLETEDIGEVLAAASTDIERRHS